MKKIKQLAVVAIVLLSGCSNSPAEVKSPVQAVPKDKIDMDCVVLVEIDSCEYLYGKWGNGTWVTHKGNCKYCKQRNTK